MTPSNRLSSWVKDDDDCCRWAGVRCNNRTGHMERLHLRALQHSIFDDDNKMLGGEIRPSLLDVTHLKHLDLSRNNFRAMIGIPVFLGSFKELRYPKLSKAGLNGRVPPGFGNLSTLQHLDLSCSMPNFFFSSGVDNNLKVEDTRWLSRLTSLRHLDMSFVWLKKASSHNWLHALTMLPSILEIRLSECGLDDPLPSSLPHHDNFTSLSILDLSVNNFNSTIPEWLCNLTSLSYLNLSSNQLYGLIPAALGNLTSLEYFDLSSYYFSNDMSGNQLFYGSIPPSLGNLVSLQILFLEVNSLTGSIPASLGNLVSLQSLGLEGNNFIGNIPKTLGRLSNLTDLDLGLNNLEGILTEHFMNLAKLKFPLLALKVSSAWNPPFRLDHIYMAYCLLGPQFPLWLRTQEDYIEVEMSYAGISDTIPDWFWNLSTRFEGLYLSHNKIGGKLQSLTSNHDIYLDLSDNLLSGPLPPSKWEAMPHLRFFSLSTNGINGTIPLSICKATYLQSLDLSSNFLSGELPKCWEKPLPLIALNLSNNNLSGVLPSSICMTMYLMSLHLDSNNLSGELFSLSNCTELVELNLSQNRFNGSIPPSIGQNLASLKIRSVHSNKLSGTIPSQLSNLTALQILDLSHNQLSGFIPESFGNFTAMKSKHIIDGWFIDLSIGTDNMMLSVKGRELQYEKRLLSIVVTIDLSNN